MVPAMFGSLLCLPHRYLLCTFLRTRQLHNVIESSSGPRDAAGDVVGRMVSVNALDGLHRVAKQAGHRTDVHAILEQMRGPQYLITFT
jgi:hypothetical protein